MRILSLLVATVAFFIDRISKSVVYHTMYEGESIPVLPDFFYLSYIKNEGIAFGLFAEYKQALIIANCVAISIILFLLWKIKNIDQGIASGLGLILGGAVGNLWDRICLGGVVDFIDIGFKNYRWPTFNFADSAICIGVLILLLTINKKEKG